MASRLSGVLGAALTPFDDSGRLNRPAIEAEVDFMSTHCDAVSVLGAEVSEYRNLTPAERRSLLADVTAHLGPGVVKVAGASAQTPREVVELADLAANAGADLIQVLMPNRPWGGQPTASELLAYFTEVTAKSPLPVVLYHHPGQGADPAWGTIVELSRLDGVVAVKDSSRNIARCLRAVEEIDRAGHARYLATVQPMLAVLLSGGAGAMMPAPLTLVGAGIRDAVRDSDLARAGELQRSIALIPDKWSQYGLTAIAKRAMEFVGVDVGDPLPPFGSIPREFDDEIRQIVRGWPTPDSVALTGKATVE